jgi:hypothetical protein
VAALSSPYRNGDGASMGPRIVDMLCATGALPEARLMPDRSLAGESILAAEQVNSGEFGESPSVPELERGLSRIRHAWRA